jgi:ATP-dependent protease Clp ATPase subunit
MLKLRQLRCSFCYKKESKVQKLVAGPRVYICDECCAIASQIMSNDPPAETPKVTPSVFQRLRSWLESLFRYKNVPCDVR